MGTPVVLTGMEATRNLRDVAYEHVCLCMCEIMLLWCLTLCVSVHMCGYRYMSEIMGVVQVTSLSQQVCLISVALHAELSAVAKWVTATR